MDAREFVEKYEADKEKRAEHLAKARRLHTALGDVLTQLEGKKPRKKRTKKAVTSSAGS